MKERNKTWTISDATLLNRRAPCCAALQRVKERVFICSFVMESQT